MATRIRVAALSRTELARAVRLRIGEVAFFRLTKSKPFHARKFHRAKTLEEGNIKILHAWRADIWSHAACVVKVKAGCGVKTLASK